MYKINDLLLSRRFQKSKATHRVSIRQWEAIDLCQTQCTLASHTLVVRTGDGRFARRFRGHPVLFKIYFCCGLHLW